MAFCPFTKVATFGHSVAEAARNWVKEAKRQYPLPFSIPKYLLTSRKVWQNESAGTPFYLIGVRSPQKVSLPSVQEFS